MPIGFADALQRVFLTTVAGHLQCRGCICRETLRDFIVSTFGSGGPTNWHCNLWS